MIFHRLAPHRAPTTTFLAFTIAYVLWGPHHPVDHQVNLGSVPFSAGTKGLECSPSTPTMNSYFYKFMINLLKRFSSERKLLEARGAFIIRSGSVRLLSLTQPRRFTSHRARAPSNHFLFHFSLLLFLCIYSITKETPPSHWVAGAANMRQVSVAISRMNELLFHLLSHCFPLR